MATDDLSAPRTASKTWWPLVVGLAGIVMLMRFAETPDVAPINCGEDIAKANVEVMMLSASWCRFCARARNYFVKNDINYCEYDIELSATGASLYRTSGVQGVPIIHIGDEVIAGFDRASIRHALQALR